MWDFPIFVDMKKLNISIRLTRKINMLQLTWLLSYYYKYYSLAQGLTSYCHTIVSIMLRHKVLPVSKGLATTSNILLISIDKIVDFVSLVTPSKEGLLALVEYNEKKIFEVKLKEMKTALTTQIAEETDISEVIQTAKQHVKDANLPDIEVVRILWDMLMDAVQWSSKNQQQNANSVLRQVVFFKAFYSCVLIIFSIFRTLISHGCKF